MTITQLEYVLAVYDLKSFVAAADRCFVTQPTLSMQIRKLEDELGAKLFDRNLQPVMPTQIGEEIVIRARRIVAGANELNEFVKNRSGELSGELRIGIIPTIAPYLVPQFVGKFIKKYPKIDLYLTEFTTEEIISRLKSHSLDAGILATPLHEKSISEIPLFYEPFVAYVSDNNKLFKKNAVAPAEIDAEETWILNEGHCFRNQVLNFCKLKERGSRTGLHYESGSVETLKRMVEQDGGLTILPELSIRNAGKKELNRVRYFKSPEPVREISMVVHRFFVKQQLLDVFMESILESVPDKMKKKGKSRTIGIE